MDTGLQLSRHATRRMQQRAIPPLLLDLLMHYGREERTSGGTMVFFNGRSKEKVREALRDALSRIDKLGDTYLVESDDGHVLTVGHRTQRIRRR